MFQHRISCCMLLFSLERLLENLENCSRLVSLTSTCVVFVSQGQGEASARLTTSIMGDCVNCIRRLLIICSAIIAFFMAVSLIYVLQLLGLILVFVNRVTLQKESLTEQLRLAYVPSNKNALQLSPGQTNDQSLPETSKDHWKKVMAEFGCCGVNGMEDFKNETYRDDCCNTLENPSPALTSCEAFDLADPETHKGFMLVGCYEKVLSVYETYPFIGAALVIVLLVVELSAMFLAVMLYREI
ncbi:tetraspanin-18-like isoform X5 [Dunckerocampus dactyliophorus]|uniref:tetraspanin-18-like isoform X5 n=1 Tax=Dunckerocampus dactyliophorus TaxID=161453 RepID=UPI0024061B1C|nr:tetraspanin-18-like isoform X5 [Dunckerocampus dactyliophorus]